MELTCAQMDILISFYIEGEISEGLKKQVEQHLESCSVCSKKYDIVKTMISEMKENISANSAYKKCENEFTNNDQYNSFKTNVSAYIDNELNNDENIKIKKITISNPQARKYLEESYSIRKMMKDSFLKTKESSKIDFSRNILRQMELESERTLGFHPAINLLIVFTISVLVLTSIILISFSF